MSIQNLAEERRGSIIGRGESTSDPGSSPLAEPAATACIVGDAGNDQENDHVDNMFVHALAFGDRAYLIFNTRIKAASTKVTRLARMMGSA